MPRPPFRHDYSCFHLAILLGGGLVLLFIIAPLASMVVHALRMPAPLVAAAADAEVRASILLTLWASMLGTLVLGILAVPCAWLLARHRFPGKGLITALIDLPVVVPHAAVGIALLGVLGRTFVGTPVAIMAAMAYVSLPFLVNAARDGFAAVPERIERTAATLGAGPLRIFFTVSLPLAWRAVLSGLVLMFARGLSEFGAVVIVAYRPMIAPILIWERFGAFGLTYARPVAVLFLGVVLVVFVLIRLLKGGEHAMR